jgi:hypothetical protein
MTGPELVTSLRTAAAKADSAGVRIDLDGDFARTCANAMERLMAEVASLRQSLGVAQAGDEAHDPVGCALPGCCSASAGLLKQRQEIDRLKGWLRAVRMWDGEEKDQPWYLADCALAGHPAPEKVA